MVSEGKQTSMHMDPWAISLENHRCWMICVTWCKQTKVIRWQQMRHEKYRFHSRKVLGIIVFDFSHCASLWWNSDGCGRVEKQNCMGIRLVLISLGRRAFFFLSFLSTTIYNFRLRYDMHRVNATFNGQPIYGRIIHDAFLWQGAH